MESIVSTEGISATLTPVEKGGMQKSYPELCRNRATPVGNTVKKNL
jgi:hypothetical protein